MAAITEGGGGSERWSLHVRYSRQEVDRWRRRLVIWNIGGDRPNRRVVILEMIVNVKITEWLMLFSYMIYHC